MTMVQLIKKGGLRERANRSRSYQGSENTEATLRPRRYQQDTLILTQTEELDQDSVKHNKRIDPQPDCKDQK